MKLSPVTEDIVDARLQVETERNLTRVLHSRPVTASNVRIGDLADVWTKSGKQKRVQWISVRSIPSIDRGAGSANVCGDHGKLTTVAFEDIRSAVSDDTFAQIKQKTITILAKNVKLHLTTAIYSLNRQQRK